MHKILIITASIRTGRKSDRVSLYLRNYIQQHQLGEVEIVDLAESNFPLFTERLRLLENPSEALVSFAKKVTSASGVILVTPEYNGGYPASLKNAIDVLYDEWYHKPIGLATVSAGPFGGAQVATSLQFSLWKIKALMVPAYFAVAAVDKAYDSNGIPSNPEVSDKNAGAFLKELTWGMDACAKMTLSESIQ